MLNEKILKRPKSGKPTLLRPLTGRPKFPFQTNNNQNNIYNNILHKNLNHKKNILTQNEDKIERKFITNSNKTIEKTHFLESLKSGNDKDSLNTILINELQNFDDINEKKEKLKKINLIEKDYEDLYEWSNLLSNSRPISSYTTLNKKTLNIKNEDNKTNESNKNKNLKKNLKHTVIECNNNQPKINKSKNAIKRNISRSRPISVYSQRNNSSYSLFSKTINDYYKENLKTFSERINVLKPKLKSNSYQLKHEIKTQRILSSKKERELKKRLNSEQINLEKQNLIIAAERKNPIPLLQSIFKQIHPGREVIKENVKMYYNTMKPFPGENADGDTGEVDYTKNDRWRWIQEMKKNRMKKKLKFNKSDMYEYIYNNNNNNYNEEKNLVLSYYNKNDPYIQMFNNIIENNNLNERKENNEKCFNPILQNFDNNFNSKRLIINENKNNIKYINNNDERKVENFNKKEIIQNMKNMRPKTGFKPNHIINNPWAKRPQTSNRMRNNEHNDIYSNLKQSIKETSQEFLNNYNNYEPYSDMEYSSSNSLPVKTISNVGNISYDKINKIIKKRKFGKSLVNDYFITSAGIVRNNLDNKCKKYHEEHTYIPKGINFKKNLSCNKACYSNRTMKNKENNKWNGYYNKNEINYYNFDDIIDSTLNKNNKQNNMYTLNYFKNIGGKYYSSSNNINVKKNRNNKFKKLNNIYTDSRYSKDDLDVEYVDEAVSSKTNSTFQKI